MGTLETLGGGVLEDLDEILGEIVETLDDLEETLDDIQVIKCPINVQSCNEEDSCIHYVICVK